MVAFSTFSWYNYHVLLFSIADCENGGSGSLKDEKRDIAFLVDCSASLREENFLAQKNVIKEIIKVIYPASIEGNRIGIIRYSDTAKIEANLNDYFTNKDLYTSIEGIPFSKGGSRIDLALQMARDSLFTVANGARADAKKVTSAYMPSNALDFKTSYETSYETKIYMCNVLQTRDHAMLRQS